MEAFNGKPRKDIHVSPGNAREALAGKKAIVVGGTDGIGRALARFLASHGASVTVVGRTFRDEGVANISFMKADLGSMKESQRVGRELAADVDYLFLTTGIMAAPTREETPEGLERDMAVSFLSRLVVLRELAPKLKQRARVYVMGFPGTGQTGDIDDLNSEKPYDGFRTHMYTVAGNEALVLDFAKRFPSLDFYGLNPGLIKTKIRSNYMGEGSLKHRLSEFFIGLVTPTPEKYVDRMMPLLVSKDIEGKSPLHFNAKGQPIEATAAMVADGYATRFIEASEKLVERALTSR
jgi:NAD(P)-dependent dehydrogenase (short-subunit alcohol dehydrogenase family)